MSTYDYLCGVSNVHLGFSVQLSCNLVLALYLLSPAFPAPPNLSWHPHVHAQLICPCKHRSWFFLKLAADENRVSPSLLKNVFGNTSFPIHANTADKQESTIFTWMREGALESISSERCLITWCGSRLLGRVETSTRYV